MSIAAFGMVGINSEGRPHVHITDLVSLTEDVKVKDFTRTEQIADRLIQLCKAKGVESRNLAIDATGSGSAFADMVRMKFGRDIHAVSFGGAAGNEPASATDKKPAKDRYTNRASQLCFGIKELLLDHQITLPEDPALREELVSREYDTKKAGSDLKLQVQPKSEYRAMYGRSPDRFDACIILVDLCRAKHRLVPTTALTANVKVNETWKNRVKKFDVVTRSGKFLEAV